MSKLALQIIRENKAKHARGEDATVLDLGNCGLKELPVEALDCVWVEEFILSDEWFEYYLNNQRWDCSEAENNKNLPRLRRRTPRRP